MIAKVIRAGSWSELTGYQFRCLRCGKQSYVYSAWDTAALVEAEHTCGELHTTRKPARRAQPRVPVRGGRWGSGSRL